MLSQNVSHLTHIKAVIGDGAKEKVKLLHPLETIPKFA